MISLTILRPFAPLSAFFCLLSALHAEGPARLIVDFGGYAGSECESRHRIVELAGSESELVLEIFDYSRHQVYHGLPSGPPTNVTLTVGLGRSESDSITYSPILLERIHPQFYVTGWQVHVDSIYRNGGKLMEDDTRPSYHYLINLPEDFAGQQLCINAAIDDPTYGHLEGSDCLSVVAPCSEGDRNQVLGTQVCFAFRRQDYARVVALTDSLLQTGWRWWTALIWSQTAAHKLEQYDRELQYLDILYSTYGRVQPIGPKDSVREAREYQKLRENLLKRIEQQEQQR